MKYEFEIKQCTEIKRVKKRVVTCKTRPTKVRNTKIN